MKPQPPRIFDRLAISRARTRAEHRQDDPFLVRNAIEGLLLRLAPVDRTFLRGLDVEPYPASASRLRGVASTWSTAMFNAAEQLEQDQIGFDLITSVLGLHLINDLPGALVQIRQLLAPDGVFAAALFGGLTLQELRNALTSGESAVSGGASPRIAPFADVREVGNLLQRAGFALPVADAERTTVLYRSFDQLIGDLRTNAQTNVLVFRSSRPISRRTRDEAIAHYQRKFSEPDGRLRATFEVIYVIAFAPAENQPKPLRPGSAMHRLAETLGTQETPLSESPTFRDGG